MNQFLIKKRVISHDTDAKHVIEDDNVKGKGFGGKNQVHVKERK